MRRRSLGVDHPADEGKNITYLPAIDQLRALAAVLIAFYHGIYFLHPGTGAYRAHNVFQAFLFEGHTAVSLFLVMSGFLFSYGAWQRNFSAKGFWFNRFLRIYPLFLSILLIAGCAFPAKLTFETALMSIAGFGNAGGALVNTPLTKQFWTIAVECQFYALFPLLLALQKQKGAVGLLQIAGLLLVFRALCVGLGASAFDLSYWTLVGRLDQFFAGMIAASLFRARPIPKWIGLVGAPLSLLILAEALLLFNHAKGYQSKEWWIVLVPSINGILWAAFVLCYLGASQLLPGFIASTAEWIGARSYSMYLLHVAVIELLRGKHWLLFPGSGEVVSSALTMLCLGIPLTLALSTLTFQFIEMPFLALRRLYFYPRHAQPSVAAQEHA